jgi:hypothetical protein
MTVDAYGERRGSVAGAALWMIVLSILLFWLPVLGPLIAGAVGGYKAGNVSRALVAASLPALAVAIFVFLLATLTGLPLVGALAGFGLFLAIVFHSIPLFIGAAIGGII